MKQDTVPRIRGGQYPKAMPGSNSTPLPLFLGAQWLLLFTLAVLCPLDAAAAAHPRVLLDSQELTMLRRQVSDPGWKRDLYRMPRGFTIMNSGQGVRANAELWHNRKIEIPAYGGHFHHFFCTDGERLEVPKEQKFFAGPYRCPACAKLYEGEKFEAAMRRLLHGWLAQAALDLALAGALQQQPQFTAKATEILLKYAQAYPGPHTSTVKGGMIYQSLDESMWVIPLAQAYDLAYQGISAQDRTTIESFLRTVAKGIQSCGTRGNWGSWHLSAVGVVGYAIGDQELIDWATEMFKRQIRSELGDDGLWPESVHTYHYYPLLAFMHFAEAAWHAGVDLYGWEAKPGKSLLTMFTVPLQYAYPDLRLAAINDGWFAAFVPADSYELAYHRTRDPRFAWVLERGYRPGVAPAGLVPATATTPKRDGFYAFLFGDEIPRQTTPPSNSSVNFPVLGIAMLRSPNGAVMSFDYGPFLGHGQRDKMGITLYAKDQLWVADYGTPGYGSGILPWYVSTFSHNTIVVDNKNQNPTRENYASLWLGQPGIEGVQSQTEEAYPGVRHVRTVLCVTNYFIVMDELTSTNQHTYDFYLHSEGTLSLNDCGQPRQVDPPNQWIGNVKSFPPQNTILGQWRKETKGLAFALFGTGPVTVSTGECPAETGARKIPLLIARQTGRNVRFLSVLVPYQHQYSLRAEWADSQVRIRHDGLEDLIALPTIHRGPALVEEK
ncbi:MAG TPA: alginate lyase family protein [Clostridia bacterium]|nr:alginate lyase family protein [Clostridia bacterium]